VSWSIVSKDVSCYGTNRRQKVLTEQDVTVISAINFYTGLNEHQFGIVPSSDTATDTMSDFEKVDRVRRRYLPLLSSKWGIHAIVLNGYFPYWKLLFLSPFLKQLLLKNCAVDFVEICNIYIGKMIIKGAERICNSDKICRSYSDLNFGVTFLEHSVHCVLQTVLFTVETITFMYTSTVISSAVCQIS